jgi:hypothetical protein
MRPRSWELAQAVKQYSDEMEKSQDRDVDNEILLVISRCRQVVTDIQTLLRVQALLEASTRS